MPVDIDAIIRQMEWATLRGVSELTVTLGDTSVHLRRAAAGRGGASLGTAAPVAATVDAAPGVDAVATQTIDAPMAGICHLSDSANNTPFVEIGDDIRLGQTLCIIEAMKVMTSITATVSGKVSAVLVDDGGSVSAHAPLFEVRP